MKGETQALHLAQMMQKHIQNPSYELILPLVMIQSKKLKKLSVDDVLLTDFDRLDFSLIDGDTVCANMRLKHMKKRQIAEIIDLNQNTIKQYNTKKYDTFKISFGKIQNKGLKVGDVIDLSDVDLEKVTLESKGETIAEGFLVNVNNKIAIQIKKVN